MRLHLLLVGLCAILAPACKRTQPLPAAPPLPPPIAELPVTLLVRQRSTTPVPGTDRRLFLTVGDVTRGQVAVSLKDTTDAPILSERSMSSGDDAPFRFRNAAYRLKLKRLSNSLLGEDTADFQITADPNAAPPAAVMPSGTTDAARIEALLTAVAGDRDVRFIRNGTDHDAADAANHLRIKWESAGKEKVTVEQFLTRIAAKSSYSGEGYQVRLSDGRVQNAEDYFRQRLSTLETTGPKTP